MSIEEHWHCDRCGRVLSFTDTRVVWGACEGPDHNFCSDCNLRRGSRRTLDILKTEPTGPVEFDDAGKVIWRTGNREQIIDQLKAYIAECESEKRVLELKLELAISALQDIRPWHPRSISSKYATKALREIEAIGRGEM